MCVAIPWTVVSQEGILADVERGTQKRRVDVSLIGTVNPGDIVLVFRDQALRTADVEEARQINLAVESLAKVLEGTATEADIEVGLDGLSSGEPTLPPHLQALVGKKTV